MMTLHPSTTQLIDSSTELSLQLDKNNRLITHSDFVIRRPGIRPHRPVGRFVLSILLALWRLLWKPFTVFRIGNVPVQIHSTCIIIPLFLMTQVGPMYRFSEVLCLSLMFFILFFFSLLAHEFAHVWAARAFGIQTQRVIILPIAALAMLDSMPRGAREFWIAAAGPTANLILAGIFWFTAQSIDIGDHFWIQRLGDVLLVTSHVNLILALYNLLPCHPLDGGRMLRALLVVLIGRVSELDGEKTFLLATKIAVRYFAWLVTLGVITVAILSHEFWFDAMMFMVVLAFAEAEYWLLRTEPNSDVDLPETKTRNCSATSRCASSADISLGR